RAREILRTKRYSEHNLLIRDAVKAKRPTIRTEPGDAFTDFVLTDGQVLRIRLIHPDKPEHKTGVDLIYEFHSARDNRVRLAVIQYKVWRNSRFTASDIKGFCHQLAKMRRTFCAGNLCIPHSPGPYRLPCCTAFFRPTD